jgi:hypothetical protein
VKFAAVWIGVIAHGLGNSFEEAPAIAGIERRGRSLQRAKVLVGQS